MKTKIYHGSLNQITIIDPVRPMWFSSNIDHANEAILMQDNFQSEGSFGFIYEAEINENEVYVTDNFAKFDNGLILTSTDANIIRCTENETSWYLVRNVSILNIKEI